MRRLVPLLALALLVAGCGGDGEKKTFVTIGTGGTGGVYYPTGGHLATLLNDVLGAEGVNANAESTSGSVFNIKAVLNGNLQLGIAQSDRQYQAVNGLKEWEGKPQDTLRAICSLHPEVVTLVATVDSGIAAPADLEGKRVNIGNPGSGQLGNSTDVLTAFGLDADQDIKAERLKAADAPASLLDGNLDAFFYTVGHPSGSIKEATAGATKVRFVPITGEVVDTLVAEKPFYAKATIAREHYPMAAGEGDVPSFGVKATLVCSADLDEDLVYKITKAIFEHVDTLKTKHPALGVLEPEMMLEGLSAPIHPGALRYFKEAKLK